MVIGSNGSDRIKGLEKEWGVAVYSFIQGKLLILQKRRARQYAPSCVRSGLCADTILGSAQINGCNAPKRRVPLGSVK